MTQEQHDIFMRRAIALSLQGMQDRDGGPFGAVIVKDEEVIAEGNNQVTSQNDPTMHAEIVAIRRACEKLGTFDLSGCTLYTSCEPCPMCVGAVYWSHLDALYYANTKEDAAAIGFDDQFIYEELALDKSQRQLPMTQILHDEAIEAFRAWEQKEDKIAY